VDFHPPILVSEVETSRSVNRRYATGNAIMNRMRGLKSTPMRGAVATRRKKKPIFPGG